MPHASVLHRARKFMRPRNSILHPRNNAYKWILLFNVMIGTFMAVLDATIVNVGLPKIMASYGVGLDKIEWVLTAYLLALAVMLPTSGWMADKFGYKRMYFVGLLLFTVGSMFCGMSPNENILILSRVIQGLGGGMIQPLGMAIITREFPPEKRGVALGFWAVSAAASVSFGPLIGGYLVDSFNWKLIFDVNIPVGIAAMLATFIIQEEYKSKKVRKFDVSWICLSYDFPSGFIICTFRGHGTIECPGMACFLCFGMFCHFSCCIFSFFNGRIHRERTLDGFEATFKP